MHLASCQGPACSSEALVIRTPPPFCAAGHVSGDSANGPAASGYALGDSSRNLAALGHALGGSVSGSAP